jgi:hypothetical protein
MKIYTVTTDEASGLILAFDPERPTNRASDKERARAVMQVLMNDFRAAQEAENLRKEAMKEKYYPDRVSIRFDGIVDLDNLTETKAT